MSEKCVGRSCVVCRKIIYGANYYCQKCGACICFYCGADVLREIDATRLRCPRCGAELE